MPARVRLLFVLLVALWLPDVVRADRVDELVKLHLEALGGRDRVRGLAAIRATGRVIAGGKEMRFTMTAARPDKIRVETEQGRRTLVQASDGKEPAWEFDTGEWPPRYREMAPQNAKTFTADAEFDDPLVGGAKRGFTFDYAGEVQSDGKTMHRILVTRRLTESFSLLLDPDTCLIVRRIDEKKSPFGGRVFVVTQFGDYRPVKGVLIPHQVAMMIDGQLKQRTQIDTVEPNPEISADTFTRPKAGALQKR